MGHYRWVKSLAFLVMVAAGARLATADDIMGEYEGTFIADKTVTLKASADVVAEGNGYYRIVLSAPGKEGGDGAFVEVYGRQFRREVGLIGEAGGYHWSGQIANGVLVAKYPSSGSITRRIGRCTAKSDRVSVSVCPPLVVDATIVTSPVSLTMRPSNDAIPATASRASVPSNDTPSGAATESVIGAVGPVTTLSTASSTVTETAGVMTCPASIVKSANAATM